MHIIFYDFSSAFNTIQSHLPADKLSVINVHPSLILWALDYLTNRPQFVKMQSNTNTNCPLSRSALVSDVLVPTQERLKLGNRSRPLLVYTAHSRLGHHTTIALLTSILHDDTALTEGSLAMMTFITDTRLTTSLTGVTGTT